MRTTAETMHAIGQMVNYRVGEMMVLVKVTDVKTAWGQTRVQITPLMGTGSQWVNIESVSKLSSNQQTYATVQAHRVIA